MLLVSALISGCTSGSGEGLDESGRPQGGSGSAPPLSADFAAIQANVFDVSCAVSGCHSGAAAPVGLRLEDGVSFNLLVGVPSAEVPSLLRVAPGDPEASYLFRKIEGSAQVGGRMPLNQPALPAETLAVIRQWIVAGAMPAAAPEPSIPMRVVSVAPAAGSVLNRLPTQVSIGLDREPDAGTVNAATVTLRRSGGDGGFTDGNEQVFAVAVSVSALNRSLIVMDLSGLTPVEDSYEVRVRGSGATAVLSLDTVRLDGDGDGQPGGDFVASFRLTGLQPTFRSIQDHIFTPICTACHAPGGIAANILLLDESNALDSLVGVPSQEVPTLDRVEPGDPDASYLVQKLEGTSAVGDRMPLGGPFLEQEVIDAIRDWIAAGALS